MERYFCDKSMSYMDFFCVLIYTNISNIGGVAMNEFEKDVQSKNNDVVDSIKGFAFSFVFFFLIFTIGVVISVIGS